MRFSKQDIAALIAVLAFSVSAFLPIWRIEIWAPQYPEGLVMQIGTYWMGGNVPQVNILNHYIGMKAIHPQEILELKVVPWIFGLLSVFGAYTVLRRRYSWFQGWLCMMVVSGALGILDLYRWGYNYGHDLSPDAPIKVPDMNYQPPLIGEKVILNIHSFSLPDIGGYVLFFSCVMAMLSIFWGRQKTRAH